MSVADTGLDIRLERLLAVTPQEAYDAWIDDAGRRSWYTPVEGWTVETGGDVRVDGKWFARFGPTAGTDWTGCSSAASAARTSPVAARYSSQPSA